jgi:predicted flap endonuclease-1-like 5' DNA nuclease
MKRIARLGGVLVGLGAGVVAALWLLKDKIAGPPTAPVEPAEAPRFRVASVPAAPGLPADDLSAIKGIGPVYSARLAEAGIESFAALAAADAAALAEQIDAPTAQLEDWIAQAQGLVVG